MPNIQKVPYGFQVRWGSQLRGETKFFTDYEKALALLRLKQSQASKPTTKRRVMKNTKSGISGMAIRWQVHKSGNQTLFLCGHYYDAGDKLRMYGISLEKHTLKEAIALAYQKFNKCSDKYKVKLSQAEAYGILLGYYFKVRKGQNNES